MNNDTNVLSAKVIRLQQCNLEVASKLHQSNREKELLKLKLQLIYNVFGDLKTELQTEESEWSEARYNSEYK
jgi:23S rRNA maturation-related 3'-5' exoribonuclease YhaM